MWANGIRMPMTENLIRHFRPIDTGNMHCHAFHAMSCRTITAVPSPLVVYINSSASDQIGHRADNSCRSSRHKTMRSRGKQGRLESQISVLRPNVKPLDSKSGLLLLKQRIDLRIAWAKEIT